MADFGITLGPEYAKKRPIFSTIWYLFQKEFYLMAVSGQTFDNYNDSI